MNTITKTTDDPSVASPGNLTSKAATATTLANTKMSTVKLDWNVDHTFRGIEHIDMVPNLSPQNLVSVAIGKDFMLSHGYIKHDFDVEKWAAPDFLEQAARELLEAEWKKVTMAKLPQAAGPLAEGSRLG
jgi:hypothetical protein